MKLQEEGLFPTCNEVITAQDFPAGTTEIPDYAFAECSSLTRISLPDGVTSIGDEAFGGCSSLTSITLPEGVTSIGDSAFWSCSSLTSIILPEGVTSIGEGAFAFCSKTNWWQSRPFHVSYGGEAKPRRGKILVYPCERPGELGTHNIFGLDLGI